MRNSEAFPQSDRQKFINALANADIGTVLQDYLSRTIEKVTYASVRVDGVEYSMEDYITSGGIRA